MGVGIDITDRKRIEQQLRQTNQTLSTLIAASPLAIALIKPDAEVKLWNQAAESLFGWNESEVLGRPIPIVSQEQLNECLQLREATARGETFLGMETYRQKQDGSKVIVSLSAAPLYGDNGSVSEIVVIFQDITAQKRAEAALRQLNERFQAAMQAVDGIVFEWNLSENSVYRSEGLFQLLGVKPEDAEATREWWAERIHPDDLIYLQSKLASLASADRYQDEYRVRHQDGSWVDVWERGCLQRDENGKIIAVVGFTTNITDRKLALSQLQESEERYRYLVESIPQLVWTAGIQGNLLDVNQRCQPTPGRHSPKCKPRAGRRSFIQKICRNWGLAGGPHNKRGAITKLKVGCAGATAPTAGICTKPSRSPANAVKSSNGSVLPQIFKTASKLKQRCETAKNSSATWQTMLLSWFGSQIRRATAPI
ncbi:MAG: PAS domain S-box protein [Microcoleus sp. SU_5_6]|nr:PAS domain S-box protein [Microcoleus sp. SU_5_6]